VSRSQPWRCEGPQVCLLRIVSQPVKEGALTASSSSADVMKAPSTAISGAWLPLKKAVSISTPATLPLAVPRRRTTQSAGSVLWRRVSHPSYHAPACVKTPGRRIGAVAVIRFEAAANHSSLKERTLEPSGAEMRSRCSSRTCVLRLEGRVDLLRRDEASCGGRHAFIKRKCTPRICLRSTML
jgi:hypothetical protein